jgi:two-component system nitrogen regulation response regulator GlnG/two-component system response regulator HydG
VLFVTTRPPKLGGSNGAVSTAFAFGDADAFGFVGESPAMWRLREALAFAAASPQHVLVQGRSGSGKELAARAVHGLSSRASKPIVARNAATFPEGLVDAELFGNAKNYPNPGTPERLGLIGEADRGTLVLDEIGELPESHQAHLLRVLDRSGEYQRLGESRQRRSDFRMVGVTNRPISSLKDDFLARFALRVEVPDLNRRRSDVTLAVRSVWRELAEADPELARRFASDRRQPEPLIEPRLIELLVRHQYTHNFRQLSQLFQLAVRSSSDCYIGRTAAIDEQIAAPPCEELDRSAIETALQQSNGRPTEAARLLGLRNRFALYRLMQTHGIEKGALRSGG